MLWRTAKVVFQLLGGLGAGLAVIFGVLAWQLSKGPISIGFLTEHLERELNKNHPKFKIKVGDTILTWAGWQRALDIRILDLTVTGVNGTKIGSVPEAWFSLSGDALLMGRFEPRAIEFYGPRLSIRRDIDGSIDIGFGSTGTSDGTEVIARGFFDQFILSKKLKKPIRHLKRVAIIEGTVTIVDEVLKRTWEVPIADIRVDQLDDRLHGKINLSLAHDGKITRLVGDGVYSFKDRKVSLKFNFKNVDPTLFADFSNRLIPFQKIEMPISGSLRIVFPIDDQIEEIHANITGNRGKVKLRGAHTQDLDVVSMKLKAEFKSGSGVDLEAFDIKFSENTEITLPNSDRDVFPLSSLSMSGRFSENGHVIELHKMTADLNGPMLSLSSKLQRNNKKTGLKNYQVKGHMDRIAINSFLKRWPKRIAPLPRKWITEHISEGFIRNVSFDTDVTVTTDNKIELVSISGGFNIDDTSVNYLPPSMPTVSSVSASVKFDERHVSIQIKTGRSKQLELVDSRILITGLDQIDQFADIDLNIKGGVSEQLAYINHEPFQLASKLGLDVGQTGGTANTRLKLYFILEKELSFKQIKLWARSTLLGARIENLFHGHGIDNADLNLRLDAHGVNVTGSAEIETMPTEIAWRYNFSKNANFISKYTLNIDVKDIQRLTKIGVKTEYLPNKFIRGEAKPEISYTILDKDTKRLEVMVDISNLELFMPAFGWSKKRGQKGKATFIADLENDLIADVPAFSLKAPDLSINGKANFAFDGSGLEKIEFSQFSIGRTEMVGALIPKSNGGWEAGFHGPAFDLSPIWDEIMLEEDPDEDESSFLDRLHLAAEFKKVWLNDTHSLEDLSGTFVRGDSYWHTVLMSTRIGSDATFDLQIQSGADNVRKFSMHAQNAGKVLKVLDLYPNMIGGNLYIKGNYDDVKPDRPLRGRVMIDDYRIINAPALAHVLSIMSLTGILEALQGPGLGFTKLNIPFEISQGVFKFNDANATGTSLGFTASGKIFRHTDVIDFSGTVIPAYLINSVFGRIPVLGSLLTGGEKGGGVFAANFTMSGPMEEPVVSVNPLSVLTPGFLRNIFDIFTDPGAEQLNSGGKLLAPSNK